MGGGVAPALPTLHRGPPPTRFALLHRKFCPCAALSPQLYGLRVSRRVAGRWRGRTMIAALAVARRSLLQGCSGCRVALIQSVHSSVQSHQGVTENPASEATEEPEIPKNKDFSFHPPVPGKESALRWAGKKYDEIPVVYIKATYNNTHVHVVTHQNAFVTRVTCGSEGFKNTKKGTAVAAQTTGISAGAKACAKGVSHVRVVVKGMGPGRLAAIQGLTMGGLQVVSITDNTPIPHNGCRPRKVRRL
ncbi:small ribosomal subunit protein uS11m [Paroedura picta]|uniref:small ribosomal subunit protein uS11m n=1 Tax=Paroedura picta TaxID=143630 RepID=UPI0040576CF7